MLGRLEINVDECITTGLELTWVSETLVESASMLKCRCCASVLRNTIPANHAVQGTQCQKGCAHGLDSR
jgi:hypothetical protein